MSWGTHFCHFYETKEDLLNTLVPYFKAGLEDNEFCIWVVSDPLEEETAWAALGATIPDFQRYLSLGSIEIRHARDWYARAGHFDKREVVAAWEAKLQESLDRGYAGMRASGNTSWLERNRWEDFCEYERELDERVIDRPMSILCTYPLQTSGAADLLDVARTHQFALASRHGKWEVVETPQLKAAREENKKLQAELEEKVQQLREQDARRLRTLRTVAHEVGNHLNAIALVSACLVHSPDLNTHREDLDVLGSNIRDINALMNQLLDFANLISGGEKLEAERVNLGAVYHDIAFMLEKMAEAKGLHFTGTMGDGLENVVSDSGKLRRIALNLGTNAVKYTPSGNVSLQFLPRGDDSWMMEVCDSGPGIPADEREHIFEEFTRLSSTSAGEPGAGLGLGIVRQLVELVKARLEFESQVGQGTCFRVILPLDCQRDN
jgi:signal transduction histidine kinase